MEYIMIGVVVIALIGLITFQNSKRRKEETRFQEFIDKIRPGAEVVTYSGMFGKVKEIREIGVGKEVTLDVGAKGEVNLIRVDLNAIMDFDTRLEKAQEVRNQAAERAKEEQEKEEKRQEKLAKKGKVEEQPVS